MTSSRPVPRPKPARTTGARCSVQWWVTRQQRTKGNRAHNKHSSCGLGVCGQVGGTHEDLRRRSARELLLRKEQLDGYYVAGLGLGETANERAEVRGRM